MATTTSTLKAAAEQALKEAGDAAKRGEYHKVKEWMAKYQERRALYLAAVHSCLVPLG
jgi:hypothetical protein